MSRSDSLELVRAKLSDAGSLEGLMAEYYAFDGLTFAAAAARAVLEQLLSDETLGRAWLIREGEWAIGYAVLTLGFSLECGGRDAFVDELYVKPEHRGRGVGGRALAVIEQECRSLGVRALLLEVVRRNARALEFYRLRGFEDHDRYLMSKRILDPDAGGQGLESV